MTMKIFNSTPSHGAQKRAEELRLLRVDLPNTSRMGPSEVRALSESIQTERQQILREGTYAESNEFHQNLKNRLMAEYLDELSQDYDAEMSGEEAPIPGDEYYQDVSTDDGVLSGDRVVVGPDMDFVPYEKPLVHAKAEVIIKLGDENDYKTICLKLGDGDSDEVGGLDALYGSSAEAMEQIEEFCESRWEGDWPWERAVPVNVRESIYLAKNKKAATLSEMYESVKRALKEAEDASAADFEFSSAKMDLVNMVDSVITNLGKISATGVELATMGNDGQGINAQISEPLTAAVEAMTNLRDVIMGNATEEPAVDDIDQIDQMDDDPMGDGDDMGDLDIEGMEDIPVDGEEERGMRDGDEDLDLNLDGEL